MQQSLYCSGYDPLHSASFSLPVIIAQLSIAYLSHMLSYNLNHRFPMPPFLASPDDLTVADAAGLNPCVEHGLQESECMSSLLSFLTCTKNWLEAFDAHFGSCLAL
eukprot:gnl/MRDRNA2_/MRDRNA2_14877_c0_seq1.p2 gnl/MRDRNA2_/MRDRNA2_14877_c0~~gnl/MRDRNA2_/MRDRNA2_14877_c0_seq1.p2  ORF type:complete len:106 (-),score=6.98 gnl/MRDRNA2_/MRDRNA2_14877_c0_seq1:166-483(-)